MRSRTDIGLSAALPVAALAAAVVTLAWWCSRQAVEAGRSAGAIALDGITADMAADYSALTHHRWHRW